MTSMPEWLKNPLGARETTSRALPPIFGWMDQPSATYMLSAVFSHIAVLHNGLKLLIQFESQQGRSLPLRERATRSMPQTMIFFRPVAIPTQSTATAQSIFELAPAGIGKALLQPESPWSCPPNLLQGLSTTTPAAEKPALAAGAVCRGVLAHRKARLVECGRANAPSPCGR